MASSASLIQWIWVFEEMGNYLEYLYLPTLKHPVAINPSSSLFPPRPQKAMTCVLFPTTTGWFTGLSVEEHKVKFPAGPQSSASIPVFSRV